MFFHVVAVCDNNIIGYDGKLPWLLRYDVRWYRNILGNNPIIVGRRTYEAGRQAFDKYRPYVINSRRLSLREALTRAQDEEKVFIMGGESIYQQTMDVVGGIWMVRIKVETKGDMFYPSLPKEMKLKYSYIMAEDRCHGLVEAGLHYYEREWPES